MERWSKEKAWAWWDRQPWMVGVNYVTSNAVNDIEMWMDDTFDADLIQKELRCAESLGFNSVRVFLSYAVWKNEGKVFERNFERFLAMADACHIRALPVLFDDCAFDDGLDPAYGRQPEPVYGVHNSRWVPSPGFSVQDDPAQMDLCEAYVAAIIGGHREDARILAWDLYNEPGNTGRFGQCLPFLEKSFLWARKAEPDQPLTTSAWDFSEKMEPVNAFLAENCDIIGLHAYTPIERTRELLDAFEAYDRPIFVTEWLQRLRGNDYYGHLPLFYERKVGIWQWGMIVGKTQTNLSWDTMGGGTPEPQPSVWQHDLIRADGTPFCEKEIEFLTAYTRRANERMK